MKLVVAGGGVAGLAASLAVARAGHEAVVLERDLVHSDGPPLGAFDVERRGIPITSSHTRSSRAVGACCRIGLRTSSKRSWTLEPIRRTWR